MINIFLIKSSIFGTVPVGESHVVKSKSCGHITEGWSARGEPEISAKQVNVAFAKLERNGCGFTVFSIRLS